MNYLIFIIIISLIMIIISLIYNFSILLIIFTSIEIISFLIAIGEAFFINPEKYI